MSRDNVEPDHVDMGIIYLLQKDARNYTTAEIAEAVDVSSSTVGNRIRRLEETALLKSSKCDGFKKPCPWTVSSRRSCGVRLSLSPLSDSDSSRNKTSASTDPLLFRLEMLV